MSLVAGIASVWRNAEELLIEAVKELKSEVDTLKDEVCRLKET
jgi:hypothetical protein